MVELEDVIIYGTPEGIKHLQIDITPIFENPDAFSEACESMYQMFEREVFDTIVTVDTAGSIFASTVASRMKKPLVIAGNRDSMVREMVSEKIETHHGESYIRMPRGSISKGARVIIVSDSLTHGKDILAAVNMIKGMEGKVIKMGFFIEHSAFNARRKLLKGIPLESRIISSDL